ncbi:MAG: HAD-IA family hydrolase [Lentisphaeria bacterium]|jgi:putative hydrolase of the HAD superfamily
MPTPPPAIPLRAITFDAGFTLLHPHPATGTLYAAAAARHGLELPAAEAEPRLLRAWNAARRSHAGLVHGTDAESARHFWRKVIARMFDPPPAPSLLDRLTRDLHDLFSDPATWRLDPAWESLHATLRARGLRIGLVSNWDVRLRPLLQGLGLERRFDAIAISAEQAAEKPDPALFHHARRALGVADPAACLHIGDTWNEDIVGATAAGLRAAWLNPNGAPRPDPALPCGELRGLAALTALLGT